MHLSDSQVEQFDAILCSLLEYVDRRLRVTQPLPASDAERLAIERLIVIGRVLWRNLDIVDDYVRDNPDRLSPSLISLASSWRDGLPARCVVCGYDCDGNALVETRAGTFSVWGVDDEPVVAFPKAPIAFNTALLPFGDCIVFGAPIDACGCPRTNEVAGMHEHALANGFVGLASTAADLRMRARAYRALCKIDELAELVGATDGSAGEAADMPAGFHASACAGMSLDERLAIRGIRAGEWLEDEGADTPIEGLSSDQLFAIRAAGACASLYGIIPLADAYDHYVAVADAPLLRSGFERAVATGMRVGAQRMSLWVHEGVRYLIAPSLSVSWSAGLRPMAPNGSRAVYAGDDASVMHGHERRGVVVPAARGMSLSLHERRASLLRCQLGQQRRPLERRMVVQGMTRYLLNIDTVIALRDYIDGHVPNGWDDCLFADELTKAIVCAFVRDGAEIGCAYDLLKRCGMMGCEGTLWSHTLGRLVVNAYNSLPRWDRCGWSLRHIKELLTGRREFYAPDGSLVLVGSDDPCPCGSQLRYRFCCGR